MRVAIVLSIIVIAGVLRAQEGQHASRPGWPCLAGRAVDPSYIDLNESTGGQLFLFQKGEVAQAGPVMSASYTHPATVLRAVGHLSGTRDLEFPVDSSIESLLVLVSVQCRNAIVVSRPSGSELTETNSALSVDLTAGKILRVDRPEAGKWRVRLTGTGLFVLSVLAKADIALTEVGFSRGVPAEGEEPVPRLRLPLLGVPQVLEIRLAGQVSRLGIHVADASAARISHLEAPERTAAEGGYRTGMPSQVERYRILITGDDSSGWPFQRMYPVLFRAQPLR